MECLWCKEQIAPPEAEVLEAQAPTATLLALSDDLLTKIMHELAVGTLHCRPFPGCMGSLNARVTCHALRRAADAEARVTLWREYCKFARSHDSKAAAGARAALSNSILAAAHSELLNASFVEKGSPYERNQQSESVLQPHRATVRVLASKSHSGGSGSDHEDSSSGSSVSLLIPLAEATRNLVHPELMLGFHQFSQSAYSARYEERATDDALLVWLELSEVSDDGLAALAEAAAALHFVAPAGLGAAALDRTKPKVVFAGQTTFYCEVEAGLDADFFERLARFLRLPDEVPNAASFAHWECTPPVRAWPAMLWLSMVASHSGTGLWEWFYEHTEIGESPIDVLAFLPDSSLLDDARQAEHVPPPAVRSWLATAPVVGALQALGVRGGSAMRNDLALVGSCARLRALAPELVAQARGHGCSGPLVDGLLERPDRWLVEVDEADEHSSRHDYCSTSSMRARFALPIGNDPEMRAEVEVSLSAGSGYEHDDRHVTIQVRLWTHAVVQAFGGGQSEGTWLMAFDRDPGSHGPGRRQNTTTFVPTPVMDHLAAMLGESHSDASTDLLVHGGGPTPGPMHGLRLGHPKSASHSAEDGCPSRQTTRNLRRLARRTTLVR